MQIKKILIVVSLFFLASCSRYTDDKTLSEIVRREIERYPQQRLIDVYKTFFQGFFGPAHLIADANSARSYILRELSEAEEFEEYDYQPLPPEGRFVRVNLKLVKDGKISADELTDAFVKSARPVGKKDIQEWKRIWPVILAEIERQEPQLKNFQQDKEYINALLAKDEYVVHHSEEFAAKHHPHYRVILSSKIHKIAD